MPSFFRPPSVYLALWSMWWLSLSSCDPMDVEEEPADPMDETCDGLDPKDGEAVDIQLTLLGYVTYDFADKGGESVIPGFAEIVLDEARWMELVDALGDDGGVSPDFESQVAFLSRWDSGGCGDEEPSYGAWLWEETVRIRRVEGEGCDTDMAIHYMDIGVVERGSATGFGWCDRTRPGDP